MCQRAVVQLRRCWLSCTQSSSNSSVQLSAQVSAFTPTAYNQRNNCVGAVACGTVPASNGLLRHCSCLCTCVQVSSEVKTASSSSRKSSTARRSSSASRRSSASPLSTLSSSGQPMSCVEFSCMIFGILGVAVLAFILAQSELAANALQTVLNNTKERV
jgi:hypothetical protein